MAVPFHVPDANAPSTSAVSSTTSSATMTVPQPQNPTTTTTTTTAAAMNPINREYLVQAFCEALYRYHAGGSLTAPPSPSFCTPNEIFTFDEFSCPPRHRSYSLPTSDPFQSQQLLRNFEPSPGHDMTDDDEDDDDNMNYMEYHMYLDERERKERERLKEYSGRVPQQRKMMRGGAKDSESNLQELHEEENEEERKVKNKPKVHNTWTIVALGFLAVGFGFFAAKL